MQASTINAFERTQSLEGAASAGSWGTGGHGRDERLLYRYGAVRELSNAWPGSERACNITAS